MLREGENGPACHFQNAGVLPQGDLPKFGLRVIGESTHEIVDGQRFGDLGGFLVGGWEMAHRRRDGLNFVFYDAKCRKTKKTQEKDCRKRKSDDF